MSGPPRRYRTAAGTPRRQPRVRRASPRMSPVRAGALLVMLTVAGAMYGLAATSTFGFERLEISGASITPEATIRQQVGLAEGTNLVGLATLPIVERLRQLPSVGDASVSVRLPDLLQVDVRERQAVVVWGVGSHRYAVDSGGLLFADLASDAAADPAAAPIPVVSDE